MRGIYMKMIVRDFLHFGIENAIPGKRLAEVLGYKTVRDLQREVEKERAAGAAILCDSHGAGYYLSNDRSVLIRFAKTLEARAKNTIKAAQSARRAADTATGQETIKGWYDG